MNKMMMIVCGLFGVAIVGVWMWVNKSGSPELKRRLNHGLMTVATDAIFFIISAFRSRLT
jgi:hypothetical protein